MPLDFSPRIDDLVVYPESDGKPLAENTKQLRWIVVFYGNISGLFRQQANVFIAADLFWYPVQGRPDIVIAPDVLVVFGRPKGDRRSYMQWLEDNIPLTVVFEILSPGNSEAEMEGKLAFYEIHGVEEYYVYDPDNNELLVYLRRGKVLRRAKTVKNFVSPRLGIRFDLSGAEMVVYRPDNRPFLTFEELEAEREASESRAQQLEKQFKKSEKRASQAEQRALEAEQRAARLAELSRKVRRGTALPEEIHELERLEEEA